MATNRVATPFAGMNVPQIVGDNFATWTPFANPTFVINDVTYLVQIPNYATVYDFYIDLPQIDSGTTVVLNVGDNVTTTSGGVGGGGYFTGSTAGRSGTAGQNVIRPGVTVTGNQHSGVPKSYSLVNAAVPTAGNALGVAATGAPAGIWLTLTVTTAPGTAVTTGSITGYIKYNFTPSLASQTNPAL